MEINLNYMFINICELGNHELHMFYWSEILRSFEDKIGGTYSMQWKMRYTYKIFVGKPDGKKPLGKPRHRWASVTGHLFQD
jgi:hypothetical protein